MSMIYKVTLDELIDYNADLDEIQEDIDKYTDDVVDKIDWSSAWSKRYPILNSYRSTVNVPAYAVRLNAMLDELCRDYRFNEQDAFLVLKDILYKIWKARKRQRLGIFKPKQGKAKGPLPHSGGGPYCSCGASFKNSCPIFAPATQAKPAR